MKCILVGDSEDTLPDDVASLGGGTSRATCPCDMEDLVTGVLCDAVIPGKDVPAGPRAGYELAGMSVSWVVRFEWSSHAFKVQLWTRTFVVISEYHGKWVWTKGYTKLSN